LNNLPRSLRDIFSGLEELTTSGRYARRDGLLQSIHPAARLGSVASLIVASLFMNHVESLLIMALAPVLLSIASRIPPARYLISTTLIPLPATLTTIFVIFLTPGTPIATFSFGWVMMQVTSEGISRFIVFALRVWYCFACLSLLTLTTGIEGIIGMLAAFRVPVVILQLLSLTYRYIHLTIGEAARMLFAREARMHRQRRTMNATDLRGLASILSVLILRTLERGERVYMAMKARGYDHMVIHTRRGSPMRARDLIFLACILTFSVVALGASIWF